MKNPIIIIVVLAIVAVAGFGVYTFSQNASKSDSMTSKDQTMTPKEEASTESAAAMMKKDENALEGEKMTSSRYVEYSKSALDSASDNRRVLFFYASWCPTCRPADANFTQNVGRIPEDVTLIRVNYNDPETDQEEKDLAKKYGITYQHTFVQIDDTGKEVAKWNGGQINELLSNIK